jgi:hypothetical protein
MTNDPKRNKYPTLMTDKHQLSPPRGPKTPKTRESQTETSRHAKASKDPQGSKEKKTLFFRVAKLAGCRALNKQKKFS